MGRSFIARYDGECVECDGAIFAGEDDIVMTAAGAVHVECADEPDEREPVTFPL